MRFQNKTFLVTGASSGIGEGTARRLASEGANVIVAARRKERLDALAQELGAERVVPVRADIQSQSDCEAMVATAVERFGGLDGLVANAGTAVMGNMEEVSPDGFQKMLDLNVRGTYLSIRAAWEPLKRSGGAVCATSSVSGIGGDWGAFAYNMSKGAISLMVKSLALDASKSGIRVNAVAPSFTRSELTEDMEQNETLVAKMMERLPLGRPAEPADIAAVIAFLLSADARFVNGVILPVDGGLSASNGQAPLG